MNTSNMKSTSTSGIEERGPCSAPSMERQCYKIRFRGHLDDHWMPWFHGCSMTREADGTTTMVAPVADQAELFGLLNKVRDLCLSLISVEEGELDTTNGLDEESRQ